MCFVRTDILFLCNDVRQPRGMQLIYWRNVSFIIESQVAFKDGG